MADTKSTIVLHGREVTREALVRFKQAYLSAVQAKRYSFRFDGQEVLVAYAKYVIEYAEHEMGVL